MYGDMLRRIQNQVTVKCRGQLGGTKMRDTEKHAKLGEEIIKKNPHYNLGISEYQALTEFAEVDSLISALERAFFIGVETGRRIAKKNETM